MSSLLDICSTNSLYTPENPYPISQHVLEKCLEGKGFDHKNRYTPAESEILRHDINQMFKHVLADSPPKDRTAVITAGAPGVGKATLLHEEMQLSSLCGHSIAFVSTEYCLNKLTGYNHDIDQDPTHAGRVKALNKWQSAAYVAAQLILAHLIKENYGFYFGSSSAHPETTAFFEYLKKQGYKIRVIHLVAADEVREASIREKNQFMVATTQLENAVEASDILHRVHDTFMKFADTIEFYHRELGRNAVLAAKWMRNEPHAVKKGTLEIIDTHHYACIRNIHNTAVHALRFNDLEWEKIVEEHSKITSPH